GILPGGGLWKIITFAPDYSHAEIYHPDSTAFLAGKSRSLFFLPSDQIVIVWLLAYRNGFFLHSAGAIVEGQSMLFVGHSEAGKSTTTQLLIDAAARGDLDVEILCDDRNIIRQKDEGWRVYGTWSHGDIPVVSPASAPLQAICFLEKAGENSLTPLNDRQQISRRLLGHVIKSFVTAEWWNKTLDVAERLIAEGNFYVMRFDRSNLILTELEKLALKSAKAG
ncbi:hypothetical protein JW992_14405, partial [candidate division KSB1 bacterium]|nr:hypothetical protein [candidate division KSB1 bacterium]